jgi:hypothetical protein
MILGLKPFILEDSGLLAAFIHPGHIEQLCSRGFIQLPRFHRGLPESPMILGLKPFIFEDSGLLAAFIH